MNIICEAISQLGVLNMHVFYNKPDYTLARLGPIGESVTFGSHGTSCGGKFEQLIIFDRPILREARPIRRSRLFYLSRQSDFQCISCASFVDKATK